MEDRGWFDLDPPEFRVYWTEQEIVFAGDHGRGDLEDGAHLRVQPPVAQLLFTQAFKCSVQS